MLEGKRYFYNHLGDKELVGVDDIWLPILKYGIRTATHFEAHFPDDDSFLADGKEEMRQLPQTSVTPWSGMKGAITVSGEMTPEARALFMRAAEVREPWLWDYALFRDGKELLTVSDHEDRIVTEDFIKEYMQKVLEGWFELIPEPKYERKGQAKQNEPGESKANEVMKIIMEMTRKELLDLSRKYSEKEEREKEEP